MTDDMMNLRTLVEKIPDWETRAGTVQLRIPKLRKGGLLPWLP